MSHARGPWCAWSAIMVERLGSEKRMLTEDNYNVFGRRLGRKGTGFHFAVKASLLEMQTTLRISCCHLLIHQPQLPENCWFLWYVGIFFIFWLSWLVIVLWLSCVFSVFDMYLDKLNFMVIASVSTVLCTVMCSIIWCAIITHFSLQYIVCCFVSVVLSLISTKRSLPQFRKCWARYVHLLLTFLYFTLRWMQQSWSSCRNLDPAFKSWVLFSVLYPSARCTPFFPFKYPFLTWFLLRVFICLIILK